MTNEQQKGSKRCLDILYVYTNPPILSARYLVGFQIQEVYFIDLKLGNQTKLTLDFQTTAFCLSQISVLCIFFFFRSCLLPKKSNSASKIAVELILLCMH